MRNFIKRQMRLPPQHKIWDTFRQVGFYELSSASKCNFYLHVAYGQFKDLVFFWQNYSAIYKFRAYEGHL